MKQPAVFNKRHPSHQAPLAERVSLYARLFPVQEQNGRLVMWAGPQIGAVLMPAELGRRVLAELVHAGRTVPIISHRQLTWHFLTAGRNDELPARLSGLHFAERVTVLHRAAS